MGTSRRYLHEQITRRRRHVPICPQLSPVVPTSDWDLGTPKPASLLVSPMSPVSLRIFSSLHEGCEIEPHSASGKIQPCASKHCVAAFWSKPAHTSRLKASGNTRNSLVPSMPVR